MKFYFLLPLILILLGSLFYFLTGYRSAFEADQQCHFLLRTNYKNDSSYGCDHDLETRQWILFESEAENEPAHVISRFRY